MAADADKAPARGKIGDLLGNEWFLPGLLFMAFGIVGLYVSKDYDLGNVNQMGPGYFPRMLCTGLLILGAVIGWIGLFARAGDARGSASRGFIFVLLSMAIFAVSIEGMTIPLLNVRIPQLGFIMALALTLLVAAMADRKQKVWEVLMTTALIVVLAVLIFVVALKLPFRLWPEF